MPPKPKNPRKPKGSLADLEAKSRILDEIASVLARHPSAAEGTYSKGPVGDSYSKPGRSLVDGIRTRVRVTRPR